MLAGNEFTQRTIEAAIGAVACGALMSPANTCWPVAVLYVTSSIALCRLPMRAYAARIAPGSTVLSLFEYNISTGAWKADRSLWRTCRTSAIKGKQRLRCVVI